MVVVDASAIAAMAFGDARAAEVVARLEDEALHAPSLFELEVTNATWSRCRREPELAHRFVEGLRKVLDMPIAFHAVDPLPTLALALETGLTVYDASYLWLSHELNAPLITLDKQLATAARRH